MLYSFLFLIFILLTVIYILELFFFPYQILHILNFYLVLLPVYKIIKESGEPHNKIFSVQVSYKDKILAQAEGKTKKQAQQEAAFKACKVLGIIQQEKEEESCNE